MYLLILSYRRFQTTFECATPHAKNMRKPLKVSVKLKINPSDMDVMRKWLCCTCSHLFLDLLNSYISPFSLLFTAIYSSIWCDHPYIRPLLNKVATRLIKDPPVSTPYSHVKTTDNILLAESLFRVLIRVIIINPISLAGIPISSIILSILSIWLQHPRHFLNTTCLYYYSRQSKKYIFFTTGATYFTLFNCNCK